MRRSVTGYVQNVSGMSSVLKFSQSMIFYSVAKAMRT